MMVFIYCRFDFGLWQTADLQLIYGVGGDEHLMLDNGLEAVKLT
jgi:hypothetical protein